MHFLYCFFPARHLNNCADTSESGTLTFQKWVKLNKGSTQIKRLTSACCLLMQAENKSFDLKAKAYDPSLWGKKVSGFSGCLRSWPVMANLAGWQTAPWLLKYAPNPQLEHSVTSPICQCLIWPGFCSLLQEMCHFLWLINQILALFQAERKSNLLSVGNACKMFIPYAGLIYHLQVIRTRTRLTIRRFLKGLIKTLNKELASYIYLNYL